MKSGFQKADYNSIEKGKCENMMVFKYLNRGDKYITTNRISLIFFS